MSAGQPTAVVDVREVHRSFGATHAVAGVSMEIMAGEMFGLLGPSGCGKTTLLRLIAGLDQPDQGSIVLNGVDVTTVPAYRRNVHTVFQSYALFPRMSVMANVEFGLRASGVRQAERSERVIAALELVGLKGKERRRPHELSGGEQQRVALARALVNQPPVLLLDEPLAALDAHLRREMQDELRRIQQQTQCTFILVTHDQEEAFSLCDRVAVMFAGKMRQLGAPSELYRHPETLEVARFVGRSSLLPAVWSGGRAVVNNSWSMQAEAMSGVSDGDLCTLVLRPRQVRLGAEGGMAGQIKHVAFADDWHQVSIDTSIGVILAEIAEHPGAVGSTVFIHTEGSVGWVLPR
jgi:ABC-type Fe3+/spermidine/putrescine transport system ATPase subunit